MMAFTVGSAGSSPLTRGKLDNLDRQILADGLIPAHAGKTVPGDRCFDCHRAHPRSRGENNAGNSGQRHSQGSSPLTRGKLCLRRCDCKNDGLIPAHAGKTRAKCNSSNPARAHPRSRGENRSTIMARNRNDGSSPLTRGKPPHPRTMDRSGRLIPAHAGKTVDRSDEYSANGAHPRSRGENVQNSAMPAPSEGSSPLTRGKPVRDARDYALAGLIPAHAGKTSPS